jgi:hypothetical protein
VLLGLAPGQLAQPLLVEKHSLALPVSVLRAQQVAQKLVAVSLGSPSTPGDVPSTTRGEAWEKWRQSLPSTRH